MVSPRSSKDAALRKPTTIREVVTYPRIQVTPANDSCLNPSMSYEHILGCGHIVLTQKPDEQCAANCHHVENHYKAPPKKFSKKIFYCDACFESEIELLIPHDLTSTEAGKQRRPLPCFDEEC